MPELDGNATMRAIRKMPQFADLPIIALTAKAMKGDREKSIKAGASDYFPKPVETDHLLQLMRHWLRRSSGAGELTQPRQLALGATEVAEKAKILLVDDRAENIVALEAILSSLNQVLVPARSGDAALKALLSDEFAVILLDVLMPGMDGFETAAHIKRRPKTRDVPIIFLTARNAEPDYAFRSYSAGAVDYIAKPFDPWVLRAKVSVFVDLYMKNRQLSDQAAMLRAQLGDSLERRGRGEAAGCGGDAQAEVAPCSPSCPRGSRRSRTWSRCCPGRPPPRTAPGWPSPCGSWSTAWPGCAASSTRCAWKAEAVLAPGGLRPPGAPRHPVRSGQPPAGRRGRDPGHGSGGWYLMPSSASR